VTRSKVSSSARNHDAVESVWESLSTMTWNGLGVLGQGVFRYGRGVSLHCGVA
jgi:hypothetical protein